MARRGFMVNSLLTQVFDDPAKSAARAPQRSRIDIVTIRSRAARPMTAALLVATALSLAACKGREPGLEGADSMATGSAGEPSFKAISDAGAKWEKDRGNARLGLAYAAGLQSIGQQEKRLEVLKTVAAANPKEPRLMNVYGKALAESGHAEEASNVLARSAASGPADWKTLSALGSSYDQQGRYAEARTQYEAALQASPNNPSILNNMGMSYALEGNLPKAEEILRKAAALPGGAKNPRLTQNLSLVVGLQGRFDEAREIASRDLPLDQVEANMAYLQKMLAQPNTWQQLKNG
jgi:Flp pilus assembly protein TadD